MTTYQFPNQKCAIKNCNKKRKHLVIFVGLCMNLCTDHIADLENNKPLILKHWEKDNALRIINE